MATTTLDSRKARAKRGGLLHTAIAGPVTQYMLSRLKQMPDR